MKRLGMILVMGLMWSEVLAAGFAPTARYSFELAPHKHGKVLMDFKQQKIVVDIQGRRKHRGLTSFRLIYTYLLRVLVTV